MKQQKITKLATVAGRYGDGYACPYPKRCAIRMKASPAMLAGRYRMDMIKRSVLPLMAKSVFEIGQEGCVVGREMFRV